MSRNVPHSEAGDTPKPALDPQQIEAITSIFEGLSVAETAKTLGIDRKTIFRWMKLPEWIAVWNDWSNEAMAQCRQRGVNSKLHRARVRETRHDTHLGIVGKRQQINAKSEDPDLASGYYKRVVIRHKGKDGSLTEIEKAEYDRDLVATLVTDEVNAAKEFDPPVQKHELTGKNGGPIQHQVEVTMPGHVAGPVRFGVDLLLELLAAGRMPTTVEDANRLLKEMDDRNAAIAKGKPVPPMSEPYIPALDDMLEETPISADDEDEMDE